jgi:hypothetical protein
MSKGTGKRVFLSYSSDDMGEVDTLDLELRRRGVQLWRDRESLDAGRLIDSELEEAADSAAGFTFYLTVSAARSDWVRERELAHALCNAGMRSSFGVVPIFREDLRAVCDEMDKHGKRITAPGAPSRYDLSRYAGYVIDQDEVAHGRIGDELRRAADTILRSWLRSLSSQRPAEAMLSLGLATRGGPGLKRDELDLVIDWSADFDKGPPDAATCKEQLEPALESLWRMIQLHFQALRLRLVPKCHNTMALAAGFQLRRNTGATLEVGNPNNEEVWNGPAQPLDPLWAAWKIDEVESTPAGAGIAMVITISQPVGKALDDAGASIRKLGLKPAVVVTLAPAAGTSNTVLNGLAADEPHGMAVAVAEKILELRSRSNGGDTHLFYAGPPGLAILIGQQLSNTGPVQTYEWLEKQKTYTPMFRHVSS